MSTHELNRTNVNVLLILVNFNFHIMGYDIEINFDESLFHEIKANIICVNNPLVALWGRTNTPPLTLINY